METILTAQIALSYLGCEVLYGYEGRKKVGTLTGHNAITGLQIFDTSRLTHLHHNVNPDLCQLILTPISQISEDDAIEVAKMIDEFIESPKVSRDEYCIEINDDKRMRHVVIMKVDGSIYCNDNQNCNNRCIDYLRSLGYDCGYGSIPSLIEVGIAVNKKLYEKE